MVLRMKMIGELGNLDNPASILRHKGYLKAKKNKWI